MITNSSLTIYHKTLDTISLLEKWTRYNIEQVWCHGGRGANINKGYENANDLDIRIPNNQISIKNIAIGDIVVKGTLKNDIETQQDLDQEEVYNITSIVDNSFGNNPHIHLGAK